MRKIPHLADQITVELSERDFLTCTNPHIPTDSRNLAYKALALFRQTTNLSFFARIHIEKNIPVEAGLGGGSSDAATILEILNELHNHPLSCQDLITLGSKLGSDIPFFFSKDAAIVRGMGEQVEEIELPSLEKVELFKPDYGLCTGKVYAGVTPHRAPDPDKLIQSFVDGKPILHNDLEASAYTLRPELLTFRKNLEKRFSRLAMSGSGTAHFSLPG